MMTAVVRRFPVFLQMKSKRSICADPFDSLEVPFYWLMYFIATGMMLLGGIFFVLTAIGRRAFTENFNPLWQVSAVCGGGLIVVGALIFFGTFFYRRKRSAGVAIAKK